jgi:hypothetical protein
MSSVSFPLGDILGVRVTFIVSRLSALAFWLILQRRIFTGGCAKDLCIFLGTSFPRLFEPIFH